MSDKSAREVEHENEVGDVLRKLDSSNWVVTNRMIDVDTGETLYRLREDWHNPATEVLTEEQVSRAFDVVEDGDRDV
ncbi:hypothetical protein [Halocalculus aciditolerans]|uniref:Uncharacterized protein n=1 Tax=Halocalculus aciditolerans TaxID=1383812 RepID=A0A830F261_9EURY|nr:hypothetical protein [Halocalculus aciditolerans]GGL55005.1 hypothetical protein GCM10009039_11380 [Halocalculus aciditolerans]